MFKALTPQSWNKYIPTFCAALGLALGLICFFSAPGYLPAENPVVAAAIGAVSGWAATGLHQSYRQARPKEDPPCPNS